jgi:Ca-activated chloride channel homolog
MRLHNPEFLFLFVLWIPMLWVYLRREKQYRSAVRFSDLSVIKSIKPSSLTKFRHSLFVLRLIGVGLLIVALARPQMGRTEEEVTTEGVDIMLVLDASSTMSGLDFQPKNRLFVAKETIKEFIKKRPNDRMGLVAFSARAYTKCPLTLDHTVLTEFLDQVDLGQIEDGTAIGTALATAAARIGQSPAKSRIIVLLTDGDNNRGEISPLAAAQAAGELGIKIYAIGVGREGQVPYPAQYMDPFTGKVVRSGVQMIQSTLNEQALMEIADATRGKFFRAQDAESLKEIYAIIDKMEKTEIKTKSYTTYSEKFFPWLLLGAMLLFLELVLAHTRFRRIP